MNTKAESTMEREAEGRAEPALPAEKARSGLSSRFLIVSVLIVVVGYFGGRWAMTKLMVLQEESSMAEKVRAASQIEYPDHRVDAEEPGLLDGEAEE